MTNPEAHCSVHLWLASMAAEGVCFHGSSTAGSGWIPGVFVAEGGRWIAVPVLDEVRFPITVVDQDGNGPQLDTARAYWAAMNELQRRMRE